VNGWLAALAIRVHVVIVFLVVVVPLFFFLVAALLPCARVVLDLLAAALRPARFQCCGLLLGLLRIRLCAAFVCTLARREGRAVFRLRASLPDACVRRLDDVRERWR
jgi:hypothetical protein